MEQIPSQYYREVSGDLPPLELKPDPGETRQLETARYSALTPQYNQVSFSVTSLMNYARCPRYYYLRYILGMPELRGKDKVRSSSAAQSGLSGTQRGNIVHRVCEQIRDPEELGDLVDYAATMEGIELDSSQKAQLEKIITSYLQSDFFRRVQAEAKSEKIALEHEFAIPVGNYVINGLVDQVFVSEKGIEVLDLKSNWIRANQVAEVGATYDVQLRLYAWAMARDYGLPAVGSQAYFLIPNRLYALDSSLLAAEQTERWVLDTCQAIIQGSQSGAEAFPITGDCTICSQRHYCGISATQRRSCGEIFT